MNFSIKSIMICVVITIVLYIASIGVTAYICYNKGYEKRKSEEKIVTATKFDTTKLVQDARLNWYPKSVIDSILKKHPKDIAKIKWIDSLRVRDSLHVITQTLSYPVYEADTTFTLAKTDKLGNNVRVNAFIKQRFLPMQEVFASKFVLNSVTFTAAPADTVKIPPVYPKDHIGVFAGIKNKFDKDVYGFVGVEYYPLSFHYFQFFVGGEGNYNYTKSIWDGETKLGIKVKF